MPVTTTGFQLRPFGYFDANPALDLPRPHAEHCHTGPAGTTTTTQAATVTKDAGRDLDSRGGK